MRARQAQIGQMPGALFDDLLQRPVGHQCIDEGTVQRLGKLFQAAHCDGPVDLTLFQRDQGRLLDPQPGRQLPSRHAQRIADRPHPALGRPHEGRLTPEWGQFLIELFARAGE